VLHRGLGAPIFNVLRKGSGASLLLETAAVEELRLNEWLDATAAVPSLVVKDSCIQGENVSLKQPLPPARDIYRKSLFPTFKTFAKTLARFFPIGLFPFSISEIWLCGMPVNSESLFCVIPSFNFDRARQTPGTSSSVYSGKSSLQGTATATVHDMAYFSLDPPDHNVPKRCRRVDSGLSGHDQ